MGEVLSQDEVDALLESVPEDDGESSGVDGKNKKDETLPLYDLTKQDKVIRGKMPILEIIYQRFSGLFRTSLSNSLRKISTVSIVSTDLFKFQEFVSTLPVPTCMCIMKLNKLQGNALLVFESKLAYAIIDSYFGGTDRPYGRVEGKEFTVIEISFMKKVMDLAIKDLEEAWAPIYKIDAQYLRTEVNPQFIGVMSPSDVIITTRLDIEFESISGSMMVMIPYSTIEPIKEKLNASFQRDNDIADSIWTLSMNQHLNDISTTLVVKLGETSMSIGDLITLEKGDVIPLKQEVSEEISVEIHGIEKMKCLMGNHKGNRAIQLTDITQLKTIKRDRDL